MNSFPIKIPECESNLISFIGLGSCKDYNERPREVGFETDHVGVSFYVGSDVDEEWVVGREGGYICTLFDVQKCLEGFHRQ